MLSVFLSGGYFLIFVFCCVMPMSFSGGMRAITSMDVFVSFLSLVLAAGEYGLAADPRILIRRNCPWLRNIPFRAVLDTRPDRLGGACRSSCRGCASPSSASLRIVAARLRNPCSPSVEPAAVAARADRKPPEPRRNACTRSPRFVAYPRRIGHLQEVSHVSARHHSCGCPGVHLCGWPVGRRARTPRRWHFRRAVRQRHQEEQPAHIDRSGEGRRCARSMARLSWLARAPTFRTTGRRARWFGSQWTTCPNSPFSPRSKSCARPASNRNSPRRTAGRSDRRLLARGFPSIPIPNMRGWGWCSGSFHLPVTPLKRSTPESPFLTPHLRADPSIGPVRPVRTCGDTQMQTERETPCCSTAIDASGFRIWDPPINILVEADDQGASDDRGRSAQVARGTEQDCKSV